jgi:hypothetical protein
MIRAGWMWLKHLLSALECRPASWTESGLDRDFRDLRRERWLLAGREILRGEDHQVDGRVGEDARHPTAASFRTLGISLRAGLSACAETPLGGSSPFGLPSLL